jgi:hypothetical protein
VTKRFCDVCERVINGVWHSVVVTNSAAMTSSVSQMVKTSKQEVCAECTDRVIAALQPPPKSK